MFAIYAIPDRAFEPLSTAYSASVMRALTPLLDVDELPIIRAVTHKADLDVAYRPINLLSDRMAMALSGALPSEVWS